MKRRYKISWCGWKACRIGGHAILWVSRPADGCRWHLWLGPVLIEALKRKGGSHDRRAVGA